MALKASGRIVRPAASVAFTNATFGGLNYLNLALSAVLDPQTLNRYIRGDAVSTADFATLGSAKALLSEAAVLDVAAIAAGLTRSEGLSVTESIFVATTFVRQFTDPFGVSDINTLDVDKVLHDTVAASEQLAINSQSDKTDTVQTADSTALSVALPATNTVSVNDILARTVAYVRTLFDTVGIDDNATIGGVEKQTQADKTNVVSIAEEQQFAVFKSAVDQASLSDALSALFERSVSDGVSLTEEIVIVNRSLASSVLNNSALNTSAFNI